jgi:hypothetical protein
VNSLKWPKEVTLTSSTGKSTRNYFAFYDFFYYSDDESSQPSAIASLATDLNFLKKKKKITDRRTGLCEIS